MVSGNVVPLVSVDRVAGAVLEPVVLGRVVPGPSGLFAAGPSKPQRAARGSMLGLEANSAKQPVLPMPRAQSGSDAMLEPVSATISRKRLPLNQNCSGQVMAESDAGNVDDDGPGGSNADDNYLFPSRNSKKRSLSAGRLSA